MKLHVFSIVLVLLGSHTFAAPSVSSTASMPAPAAASFFIGNQIKSYKEWKGEKIHAVSAHAQTTRTQILKAKTERNSDLVESLEKQEKQQQWNLDVANYLSVADYFVLYLSQQTQPERFREAAKKMTPTEVAELMEAYAAALAPAPLGEKLPTRAAQTNDQIK